MSELLTTTVRRTGVDLTGYGFRVRGDLAPSGVLWERPEDGTMAVVSADRFEVTAYHGAEACRLSGEFPTPDRVARYAEIAAATVVCL